MIQLNPQYETIFDVENIDDECTRIAKLMEPVGVLIKDAVTMYLQLLKSMTKHFVDDEHFCYFDDMYSPEYSLQWIYEDIMKYELTRNQGNFLKKIIRKSCRANAIRNMAILHT